ncbi:hypothetical protein DFJ77DRAFT_333617 [Powellomyces hirtus]|nr:hypothetical protein DFJ77DRAFT_333617 [Powellomyces hirtus]
MALHHFSTVLTDMCLLLLPTTAHGWPSSSGHNIAPWQTRGGIPAIQIWNHLAIRHDQRHWETIALCIDMEFGRRDHEIQRSAAWFNNMDLRDSGPIASRMLDRYCMCTFPRST